LSDGDPFEKKNERAWREKEDLIKKRGADTRI